MPSDDASWSRRGFLGAVATVGLLGIGVGAETAGRFSDSVADVDNVLNAGTVNLALNGAETSVQILSASDIAPGASGTAAITVENTGVFNAYIDVQAATVGNAENACVGNEGSTDSTCGDPGVGTGELQQYLETEAYFLNGPTLWNRTPLASEPTEGQVYDLDYQLPPGGSDEFVLNWWLPDTAGDDSQSDSITLELRFRLDQGGDVGL
ncbi:MAG: hypothetical protein ABEJ57_04735 [Halobacteriaceae archaeon]